MASALFQWVGSHISRGYVKYTDSTDTAEAEHPSDDTLCFPSGNLFPESLVC